MSTRACCVWTPVRPRLCADASLLQIWDEGFTKCGRFCGIFQCTLIPPPPAFSTPAAHGWGRSGPAQLGFDVFTQLPSITASPSFSNAKPRYSSPRIELETGGFTSHRPRARARAKPSLSDLLCFTHRVRLFPVFPERLLFESQVEEPLQEEGARAVDGGGFMADHRHSALRF